MPDKHDLLVVGAGVLGTFHAFHALRRGLSVTLLEKDRYPVQATVRNFGQVVPSGMAGRWFDYGRRSLEWYRFIQERADITVRPGGTVYIASDPEEQQLLHELHEVMTGRAYPVSMLSPAACLERWPALQAGYCREGLFFPEEVSVAPEAMIYRLLDFMQESFPRFTYRTLTTAVDCRPSGDGVAVVTNAGETIFAAKAIVCNGGEFKLLFPQLFERSGIVVSKLQMMRTRPMPSVALHGNVLTGLTIRRYESFEQCPSFAGLSVPEHLRELKQWGIHILFKQADDGSIIIGDSHEYAGAMEADDLGFSINSHINELMLREASRIVSFDVRNLDRVWAGFYPQHKERDIVEEDLEGCIHIRTAIGGKGMTSAAGYAEESITALFGR
ncbi:TIGR03364 family FAD-dependent oxidoreductase [Dinghuibacter silviterrae]|uniref:FAD dependent oxidoreductase TIGR03364 n=1 Tax=Dinghuibacter silviterrae TaxID=1539049 RepID=A0A4R8DR47_9BACT|nr:TIGR03364 family FAD-dependent oxidoreductase [Dinghuibacter silviterrae]TDX00652.1 FAD dependent oxidoreductase TIGR03364 [Dinghuibacter silviterrae]